MLEVTCAIIQKDQQILICQRSETMKLPLKWEFPGGKVEDFETKEDCIVREIKEELNIEIDILYPLKEIEHDYADISIRLFPFVCQLKGGDLRAKEHKQAIWVEKSLLGDYDWAEADIPITREITV